MHKKEFWISTNKCGNNLKHDNEAERPSGQPIDLKIDNLDRVSIPTKIVATFDVEHPIHGTTYGV